MAENKPSSADPSESDVNSEESEQDVSEETPGLKELEELAGREFESKEDFEKHYENLKEFSGTEEAQELRQKAKKYDEIQNAADDLSEEDKDKLDEIEEKTKVEKLEERLNKSEFIQEHPDAEEHFDLVKAVADHQEVSFKEAWEDKVRDYGVSKSEKEKEKSDSIKSKSRIGAEEKEKLNNLAKRAQQGSDDAGEKLVEELGLSE